MEKTMAYGDSPPVEIVAPVDSERVLLIPYEQFRAQLGQEQWIVDRVGEYRMNLVVVVAPSGLQGDEVRQARSYVLGAGALWREVDPNQDLAALDASLEEEFATEKKRLDNLAGRNQDGQG
jgi:hypothetical protein